MKKIEFLPGDSIDTAWKGLLRASAECGDTCFGEFNGREIRSTDTLDEAYMKILGKTKSEHEKEMQDWRDEYERKEKEHKDNIPNLIPIYREKARGVILEEQYEYWDKIVPIRLDDLYHGMELDATLDLCKIMRDESMSYDKRLKKAYDTFMNQGHSGMSAGLVASMLRTFCPDGHDLADAVMNFRYGTEHMAD
jgi:predicted nuclease with TOPRIM domain